MLADRVVVLGGGFAALETAFQLTAMVDPNRLHLTVVSDRDHFLYRPGLVGLPFGAAEAPLHVPLSMALDRWNITRRLACVENVDTERRIVHTNRVMPIHYDHLVIATGAQAHPHGVPGLAEHAAQISSPGQLHRLGERFQWVAHNAGHGRPQHVLFVVPPGTVWPGPAYEIALMFDTWLRRRTVRHQVRITFATAERAFGEQLGAGLHRILADEFATRGITGETDLPVTEIAEVHTCFDDGSKLHHDLVVALPPHAAALWHDGLPADDRGFLTCRPDRSLVGRDDVFAPGDAGDFPVKQSFLAVTQARAVAAAVAARITGRPVDTGFEPTALCVLDTVDKGILVEAPLTAEGLVRVDHDRVLSGPAWRAAKYALARYVPMRYRHGKPALPRAGHGLLTAARHFLER
ncbi:NAD(P)/FAD-dependent oxidoreductase [Kutzneria sp. 744]|jgi:NADH dehydrogenase FAD-containing subunit|uniref:NAD(P)/FAD-dependent oxidoreductase n=1 Tax=Kutzneria sp. (strain 744) TaxID=345341 RepID=UPI0003EEB514|nr:FAD-dependent oxidoreductase [Kutzneria sp. 744]EWM10166.1 sulfide-quinone reductase [Kutzneria sp. 744]